MFLRSFIILLSSLSHSSLSARNSVLSSYPTDLTLTFSSHSFESICCDIATNTSTPGVKYRVVVTYGSYLCSLRNTCIVAGHFARISVSYRTSTPKELCLCDFGIHCFQSILSERQGKEVCLKISVTFYKCTSRSSFNPSTPVFLLMILHGQHRELRKSQSPGHIRPSAYETSNRDCLTFHRR